MNGRLRTSLHVLKALFIASETGGLGYSAHSDALVTPQPRLVFSFPTTTTAHTYLNELMTKKLPVAACVKA